MKLKLDLGEKRCSNAGLGKDYESMEDDAVNNVEIRCCLLGVQGSRFEIQCPLNFPFSFPVDSSLLGRYFIPKP